MDESMDGNSNNQAANCGMIESSFVFASDDKEPTGDTWSQFEDQKNTHRTFQSAP